MPSKIIQKLILGVIGTGSALLLCSCSQEPQAKPAEAKTAAAAPAKDEKAKPADAKPAAAAPAKDEKAKPADTSTAKDDKAKADPKNAPPPQPKVTASGGNPGTTADMLFDKNNDSFWELSGQAPYWVMLEYPEPQTMVKYTIRSGQYPEQRMPTEWILQGSNDGQTWKDLDKRTDIEFPKNDFRSFYISKPDKFKFFRVYITKTQEQGLLRIYEMEITLRKQR